MSDVKRDRRVRLRRSLDRMDEESTTPYLGQTRWVTTHNSMSLQQYDGNQWVDVPTEVSGE